MGKQERGVKEKEKVDPILTEIIRNAFTAIVNEMGSTLERAAMSASVKDGRDYSGALSDGDGNLVAHGEMDIPIFYGTMQFTVQGVIQEIGKENFQPGDIYLMNDPYLGGTHDNDMRVTKPIFLSEEIIAYLTAVAHWQDVGGSVPGSFNLKATEAYQEGIRVPPLLIYRHGQFNEDVAKLLLANLREPKDSRADLLAEIAAVNTGEKRLLDLVKKYGLETIKRVMIEYQEYGEKMTRKVISQLRDGRYEWVDYIDEDPGSESDEPKKIKLTVHIEGDQIDFDFTGTDQAAKGAVNSTYATTSASLLIGFKALFPELPPNYGVLKAMNIIAPGNTLVNAKFPAPVCGMGVVVFEKIMSCIWGVFSYIVPERTMACCGNLGNLTWAGWDKRFESKRYFVAYDWQVLGFGGRATKDGLQGRVGFYGGGARNIPIEVLEQESPVLIEQRGFIQDSAGAGKFRGGCGTQQIYRINFDGVASSMGDREKFPPFGLLGGKGANPSSLILNPDTPGEKNLTQLCSNVPVKVGDRLKYVTGGGGGYGPPLERDPDRVLDDVIQGYVSFKEARDTYGVVLKEMEETSLTKSYALDLEATRALRSQKSH